uniref:Uncharacterized protein n=1 Tax=Ditylum brightwellii TaxID=49249 RepID=A0A7S1Z3F2_9STRA
MNALLGKINTGEVDSHVRQSIEEITNTVDDLQKNVIVLSESDDREETKKIIADINAINHSIKASMRVAFDLKNEEELKQLKHILEEDEE